MLPGRYSEGLAMGFLNRLGLRRPGPPRCFAEGRFQIAGVTVINPMHGRRAGATLDISSGAIAGISDTAAVPPSEFAGCFALPGLVDMHVHLPPDNALKLTQGAALLYLLHGVTSIREAGDLDGTAVAAGAKIKQRGSASGAAGVLLRSLCRRRQGNFQEHDPAGGREPGGGRCRRTPGQG
jgi:hypothetical protein